MIIIVRYGICFNIWFITIIKFKLLHWWRFQSEGRFSYAWYMGKPVNARLYNFWCSAIAGVTNDAWSKKVLTERKL
jgi:hypothetical protein